MRHAYMRFAAMVAVVVAAFGVSAAAHAADTTPPVTNVLRLLPIRQWRELHLLLQLPRLMR
jgi:hypothetical protein